MLNRRVAMYFSLFSSEKKKMGLVASIVPFLKNKPEGKLQGSWVIILMT